MRGKKRVEPDRRGRIINVTLDVIAEHGIAGTTHRRVAEAAEIPLGSMTYHFTGLDDLLHEAFSKFASTLSSAFEQCLGEAGSIEEARHAVVELVCGDTIANPRSMTLLFELYAYMTKRENFRVLVEDWMNRSRVALERHFSPEIAQQLDMFIEGAAIHSYARQKPLARSRALEAIAKITG